MPKPSIVTTSSRAIVMKASLESFSGGRSPPGLALVAGDHRRRHDGGAGGGSSDDGARPVALRGSRPRRACARSPPSASPGRRRRTRCRSRRRAGARPLRCSACSRREDDALALRRRACGSPRRARRRRRRTRTPSGRSRCGRGPLPPASATKRVEDRIGNRPAADDQQRARGAPGAPPRRVPSRTRDAHARPVIAAATSAARRSRGVPGARSSCDLRSPVPEFRIAPSAISNPARAPIFLVAMQESLDLTARNRDSITAITFELFFTSSEEVAMPRAFRGVLLAVTMALLLAAPPRCPEQHGQRLRKRDRRAGRHDSREERPRSSAHPRR